VVPDYCYKIVVDPPTGKILYSLWFRNDNSGSVEQITLADLKSRLSYPLVPEKDLN
jgi:endonuclease G, mitochondrial